MAGTYFSYGAAVGSVNPHPRVGGGTERTGAVIRACVAAVALTVIASPAAAQIIYRNAIDDGANARCNGCYGFNYVFALNQDGGSWAHTYLPNGGDRGTGDGAVQVTLHGGRQQYRFGWGTGALNGWNPSLGDNVFIRFRMKLPRSPVNGEPTRIKFIDWEEGISNGTDATSRVIAFLGNPWGACLLNQGTSDYGGGYRTHHVPSDYGLSGSTFSGDYVGLAVNRNIEGTRICAVPPILLTHAGNPNKGTPGYQHGRFGTYPGAVAADGWYHIQIEVKSGTAGNAYFKQWANHNVYSQPQSVQNPLYYGNSHTTQPGQLAGVGVYGWQTGMKVGHFIDTTPRGDFVYIIDDVEIGRTFDPSWYPGAASGTPTAPSNLRIVPPSLELAGLLVVGVGALVRRRSRHEEH